MFGTFQFQPVFQVIAKPATLEVWDSSGLKLGYQFFRICTGIVLYEVFKNGIAPVFVLPAQNLLQETVQFVLWAVGMRAWHPLKMSNRYDAVN